MKRFRIFTIALCSLALAMGSTSCKKDDAKIAEGDRMVIGASIEQSGNDGSKTFLYDNGSSVEVRWSAGDSFELYGYNNAHKTFTINSEDAGKKQAEFSGDNPGGEVYYAAYPASMTFNGSNTFTYEVPASIDYEEDQEMDGFSSIQKHDGPMIGRTNDAEQISFKNAMSTVFFLLEGSAKVTEITLSDENTSNPALAGTLTVVINDDGTILDTSMEGDSHSLTLNIADGVQLSTDEPSVFSFSIPKGAFASTTRDKNLKVQVKGKGGLDKTFTYELSSGAEANTAYAVQIGNLAPVPVFSVGTSTKVEFSKGNLYYDGAFKFEESQLGFTELSDFNLTHLSYFTWSRTKDVAIDQNWYEHEQGIDYSDILFTNAAENTPNSSFIVNGETGKWRTLSIEEWGYLLDSRAGNRYARAKVNDVNGLLVFPDGYTLPSGYSAEGGTGMTKVNDEDQLFPDGSIPTETWNAMELAGVVFLPAAGEYDWFEDTQFGMGQSNAGMRFVGESGMYWSSNGQPFLDDNVNLFKAKGAYFCEDPNGNVGHYRVTPIVVHRHKHNCIRLVHTLDL